MNNRERWVVYPLLLWSMAMGFRSQYEALFERDELEARQIRIVDGAGKPRLILSAESTPGGQIQFTSPTGTPLRILEAKPDKPTEDQ
jgi:hypothetical protein